MNQYEFFLSSSLEKVFPNRRPSPLPASYRLSAWKGSKAAVQFVYYVDEVTQGTLPETFSLSIEGTPFSPTVRSVRLIPSDYPCNAHTDEYYITKEAGLFPDLLEPVAKGAEIRPLILQYRSLWLSWEIPTDALPGSYPVTVTASMKDPKTGESRLFPFSFTLCVGKAALPAQTLLHTEWFHTDCLAQYYKTEVFSEEYWRIVENFICSAGRDHGINMLLTPVFTPPLDTEPGGERLTVQLVDIRLDDGIYSFGFEKLERWCGLCQKHGILYLEIAHLFTQWGAGATPKILACVDGVTKRIFGWDVPATDPAYRSFLEAFLPALRTALKEMGYDREHVYFHISDEPSLEQETSYLAAKNLAADLLKECPIIDALSSLDFYEKGIIEKPIPSVDYIKPFLDAQVPNLWTYYCCAQGRLVPNRFFAMKSARCRIMGVLMYLYRIQGFLQWGYNFYNSQFSRRPIDPYYTTHAGFAFPSGDAFLVYPGPGGDALSSIRAEVQDDGLLDLRALTLLERLTNREFVEALIYENAPMQPMTFTDYPREDEYLLSLRERVAGAIEQAWESSREEKM